MSAIASLKMSADDGVSVCRRRQRRVLADPRDMLASRSGDIYSARVPSSAKGQALTRVDVEQIVN